MLELFNNPGYFAAGSALVSAPIIIHLINRMRFRRLRWAAMEFLLKSQKKNRRRLIIEQLLLLMLRCLLVILAALLVLRFVGFSLADYVGKASLHIVVLDDTPSMTDRAGAGENAESCFQIAKNEVIYKNILKKISQSTTNERFTLIPLSELVKNPDFDPTVYEKLSRQKTEQEIKESLEDLKPSKMHVDLAEGLEKASRIIESYPELQPVVHIVSDFRLVDWSGPQAKKLKDSLAKLKKQDAKLRLLDTAHPSRLQDQGGVPVSNDNLAITDFRANSRLVGKRMPVTFTVTVANNSPNDKDANIVIYRFEEKLNPETGRRETYVQEQLDLNFNPTMPFKVPANGSASAQFKYTPETVVKDGKTFHSERFCVHLETDARQPLEDDGVLMDNLRFASVQIRNKIPILVIDSEGLYGDSALYVETAINSISDSYDVKYGERVAASTDPTEALRSANLRNYAAVYLLNVEKLSDTKNKKIDDTKLKNLENYVREGGSVAFFLGPKVSPKYYNEKLYRNGDGIFPAPIAETPTYDRSVDPEKISAGESPIIGSQLLLRDDQYEKKNIPIFGKLIQTQIQEDILKTLSVIRYFSVPRDKWTQPKGRVFEMVTLPNKKNSLEAGLDDYVGKIIFKIEKLLEENPKYSKYSVPLNQYLNAVRNIVLSAEAYQLGLLLEQMLLDSGDPEDKDAPKLSEFWTLPDPEIAEIRKEIKDVADRAIYGDPFVISRQFGKGRVVAVMSMAGNDWNDWGYGLAADMWPLFHKYMLNYLFDQSSESSLLVGTPYSISVKEKKYQQKGKQTTLVLVRTYYDAKVTQLVKTKTTEDAGNLQDGVLNFSFRQNYEDGFYLNQLFTQGDTDRKNPLETWEYVFNLDTKTESKLYRASQEEAKNNVLAKYYPEVRIFDGADISKVNPLINRQTDMSEAPLFFLFFLLVLITEQALAVHLSFHLKGNEANVPTQAVTSQQMRAA